MQRPGRNLVYFERQVRRSVRERRLGQRKGWARRFFEQWCDSLQCQRLDPFEKSAAVIDHHWDGIAAYCRPQNKASLGFVEGLSNNPASRLRSARRGLPAVEGFTCLLPAL